MFDNLPELYIINRISHYYGTLIKYKNYKLYLTTNIFNYTTDDEKLILWIILRNKYDLNITNPIENYTAALNEWIKYGKSKTKFINLLFDLINNYSKNEYLKNKHLNYIKSL